MAKQMAKSALAGKLGNQGRQAFDAHKNDETVMPGGGDLPGGIDNGIAQLVECKFDVYKTGDNKGQFYFFASGVVHEPKKVGKIPVEGLRTNIGPEPLCDTPKKTGDKARKTLSEHFAWILNEMRKLGVDTSAISFDNIEAVAAALKEAKPFFRFGTFQPEPETTGPYAGKPARVFHIWRGLVDYNPEDSDQVSEDVAVADDVEDTTAAVEEPEAGEDGADGGDGSDTGDVASDGEEPDLTALGAAADAEDEQAQVELTNLCEAAGIDPNDYATWAEVAELLGQSEGDGEEAAQPATPGVGEVYYYTPPKTKTPQECEVTAVFEQKGVCNLKNLSSPKTIYKGVVFGDLKESK